MKDIVRGIIEKILSSTNGTEDALTIYDLFEMGVDGPLLREVLEVLNKTGFVVDTHLPEAFDQVVANNIKACKKMIKETDSEAAISELKLLQKTPEILVGVYREIDNKRFADSGTPLFIKQYSSEERKLLHMATLNTKTVVMIDENILSYDSEGFSHLMLN